MTIDDSKWFILQAEFVGGVVACGGRVGGFIGATVGGTGPSQRGVVDGDNEPFTWRSVGASDEDDSFVSVGAFDIFNCGGIDIVGTSFISSGALVLSLSPSSSSWLSINTI